MSDLDHQLTNHLRKKPSLPSGVYIARGAVVLGDVDNLRVGQSGLLLSGRKIGALYRYVAFESMFGSPAFVAISEAAARLRLVSFMLFILPNVSAKRDWQLRL